MKIHSAQVVPYSSVVGQGVMLLNEAGACIGQLAVIGAESPQDIAKEVVSALVAPNRHAYRVGVSVGRAGQESEAITEHEHRADIEAETARVALLDADLIAQAKREALIEAAEECRKLMLSLSYDTPSVEHTDIDTCIILRDRILALAAKHGGQG